MGQSTNSLAKNYSPKDERMITWHLTHMTGSTGIYSAVDLQPNTFEMSGGCRNKELIINSLLEDFFVRMKDKSDSESDG